MYEVIRRGKRHNLSIECLLDLFDKIVKPILLYGCEVWGFSDNYVIEKIHLKFCKLILHLKQSTPNFMIYGEFGRFPLYINSVTVSISFSLYRKCTFSAVRLVEKTIIFVLSMFTLFGDLVIIM
jgi:hypothetical protein